MLDEIRIRNYKSLKEIAVPLRTFNVLIGPNNSGKSNIKDCLEFISEHLPHYGGEPVNRRGGFSAVVWNGDISLPVVIEISGHEKKEGIRHRFTYSLELIGGPTDYHIAKERFTAWAALPAEGARSKTEGELEEAGPAGRVLLEYPAEQGQTQFYAPSGKQSGGFGVPNSKQSFLWIARDSSRYPLLGDFAKAVEGVGLLQLYSVTHAITLASAQGIATSGTR